ncbi:Alpha/beta_hydrolase family protein [Hexamita inflata]|uniref:Alpha/beta hydrolase family protein n=1 Tax=Hexamita inflata TaxID=28002 RepID=A0AA86NFU2_9EUKA|nr:Alpha/beta hydrolase family protein [Hexamita inflata]
MDFEQLSTQILDPTTFKQIPFRDSHLNTYLAGPVNGRVIVFVHGFNLSFSLYSAFILRLQEQFRVLCVDLPGHGNSGEQNDYSLEVMVDAVCATVSYYKITSFMLCGHSLGALIAIAAYNQMLQLKLNPLCVLAFSPAGIQLRYSLGMRLLKFSFIQRIIPKYIISKGAQLEFWMRTGRFMPKQLWASIKEDFNLMNALHKQRNEYRMIWMLQNFKWEQKEVFQEFQGRLCKVIWAYKDQYVNEEAGKQFLEGNDVFVQDTVSAIHEIPIACPQLCVQEVVKLMEMNE